MNEPRLHRGTRTPRAQGPVDHIPRRSCLTAFQAFKHPNPRSPSSQTAMGQRSSRLETEAAPPAHASPFLQCAQPALASALRNNWLATGLGPWPDASKLPIVYSDDYNISFFKLEEMHPFDSKKYRRVVNLLEQKGVLSKSQLVAACEATLGALRNVHAEPYLNKLERSSLKVAQVTELAPLAAVPSFLLRSRVLRPMRLMAGGSVQAGALALERGWAVNLGGGMHHAHYADGGGWCVYDDITLMLRTLRSATGGLFERAMVIDLDVHQGNGVQRSKMHHGGGYNGIGGVNGGINATVRTFIVDVYNPHVYPKDTEAKAAIDVEAHVPTGTDDAKYLDAVKGALPEAFRRCHPPPQLIVYNAGTDVLAGDPLGLLRVTEEGVLRRDEAVFAAAMEHRVPIVMLLSGGYTKDSTPCIARSIENLAARFGLVEGSRGEGAPKAVQSEL